MNITKINKDLTAHNEVAEKVNFHKKEMKISFIFGVLSVFWVKTRCNLGRNWFFCNLNRIVYAAGAKAPLASVRLGRLRLPRLTPVHFCGCWKTSYSLYRNRKNVNCNWNDMYK